MQSVVDFLYMVDDMLWGTPMVVIVLGTGIFLSLRFGFSYQRKIRFNIKNTFGNMTSAGEGVGTVSSFRAACTGLANTVGTGNISGVATAIVYCKKKKVNFWLLADTTAPCLAFGQMLGRWGNFFNREAFGGFTNGPLAMRLQVSQVRTSDISAEVMRHIVNYGGVDYIQVHPTFLYESLWNLCLFLFLIKFRPKKKFDGQVLGLYFLGYALGRVWIEGLRTDQLTIGPFAVSQLLSGVLIICAAAFLIWKGKQEKAKKESES